MTSESVPADDAPDDLYPGMPTELRAALTAAASEGRDVWLEARMRPAGQDQEAAILFESREGSTVFVRQSDPGDRDDAPRALIHPGDRVVMTTPIAAATLNSTSVVGRVDDLITWVRVVLDRRESGKVYARTLQPGEADDGRRVHVRPGEQFVFEAGALSISLDEIDRREPATDTGYVNLTPVIWTWLQVAPPAAESVRYVLAAARRLDAANALLADVQAARSRLAAAASGGSAPGPLLRRDFFGMLSSVELMVVALGRVIDMVDRAGDLIGSQVPLPSTVASKQDAIRALRNAYEHIEDRALGLVFGKPDPHALTIFDYERLLSEDVVVYGDHQLGLADEVPALLADVREFLKTVVAGAPSLP